MPYKGHAMFIRFFQLTTGLTPFAKRKEAEFRSFRSEQNFKAGGVSISRKPGDQTDTLLRFPPIL
jgi:hypothetical protein